MENRICPSDEIISEYSSGFIQDTDREMVEKHVASCSRCRRLLVQILNIKRAINPLSLSILLLWIRDNRWFMASIISLICSFFLPRYFFQFLAASLITGAKWVIDSRTTRMLVMIYEAWRKKDQNALQGFFSRVKSDKI